MQEHKFPYAWSLKDAIFTKDKGKVFSCFACGGGSTMGYKLAGFDVIGCNEIDPRMVEVYKANHNPKYAFLEPIQTFKDTEEFPKELYELDILDGSPPCSSFSMAGSREDGWGKEKKFREGQAEQVLDTLFFDFIHLAKRLQPKVVVAENVAGLMMGNAIEYVKKIYEAFDEAGYYCQHWLLNGTKMGVPQSRERVFFVCLRKDLADPFLYEKDLFTTVPKLDLEFKERMIPFKEIRDEVGVLKTTKRQKLMLEHFVYGDKHIGEINQRLSGKNSGFNANIIYDDEPVNTIDTKGEKYRAYDKLHFTEKDFILAGSYPLDYNFLKNRPAYLVGMSVPPLMTAQVATRIYEQWLTKI